MKKLTDIKNSQELIDKIISGDKKAVLFGITSEIPIVQLNAVIEGVKMNMKDEDFINGVKNLKKTKAKFFGEPFSDFILAALDVLKIEKYTGNDEMINRLIESKFAF